MSHRRYGWRRIKPVPHVDFWSDEQSVVRCREEPRFELTDAQHDLVARILEAIEEPVIHPGCAARKKPRRRADRKYAQIYLTCVQLQMGSRRASRHYETSRSYIRWAIRRGKAVVTALVESGAVDLGG